ncbi:hypothetical protein [Haloferax sp. DFSO60]
MDDTIIGDVHPGKNTDSRVLAVLMASISPGDIGVTDVSEIQFI